VATLEPTLEPSSPVAEDALETLRELIFGEQAAEQRQRLTELRRMLDQLETTLNDDEVLAQRIAPVMSNAIATSLRDSRPAMIDALYPIIGQLITRAVTEAMRELAQRIDHQMRTTLDVQGVARHLRARFTGVSPAEMTLRDALPFHVEEIFLIHRESGLLLRYLSWHSAAQPSGETNLEIDTGVNGAPKMHGVPKIHGAPKIHGDEDSEVISGMLTAIRDFVQDAFGRSEAATQPQPTDIQLETAGQEAAGQETVQLDTVQYGDKSIIIESAQHIYAAVVAKGIEPSGFRSHLRERVIAIEHDHAYLLRHYDGDASQLADATPQLVEVLQTGISTSTAAFDTATTSVRASSWAALLSNVLHYDPNLILLAIFVFLVLFASGWLVWLLLG
jgi:hypothetical protein